MRGVALCLLFSVLSQAAKIYLQPEPVLPSASSVRQAGVTLARHLGLDYFEEVGDDWDDLLPGGQEAFVAHGPSTALLVSIDEESAEDAVPSSWKEAFSLPDDTSISGLSSLVPNYLERARHAYSHIFTKASLPDSTPRIIDIFSVSSSASQTFLSEMTTLVDFLESDDILTDKFGALHLDGLSAIAAEHGRDSEQYRLASETIKGLFSSAAEKRNLKLALVTVPAVLQQAKRQAVDAVQPPQTPFPPPIPGPVEPIDAVSTCYASTEVCGNSTNACSGHGQCVPASKLGRTCYVCACAVTKDSKGRTENWAGSACERQDVSGPFVLITGTVIGLILLVGGSVALLSGIGDQELPSTLTGGVVPTVRKD